jgi:hypothetical protein
LVGSTLVRVVARAVAAAGEHQRAAQGFVPQRAFDVLDAGLEHAD